MRRDMGDYQTPPELARQVLAALWACRRGWPRVLEPTCGKGVFIDALVGRDPPPREIQALELQEHYVRLARETAIRNPSVRVIVTRGNIFDFDLRDGLQWRESGPLLIVGNPPWVTNSELGAIGSANLPKKRNLKRLAGIEALTGESNFDVAEFIWIKILRQLGHLRPTIALLCKTSVARNVLKFCSDTGIPIRPLFLRKIDAARWFGTAVGACLFCVEAGAEEVAYTVPVYPSLEALEPETTIGVVRGRLVADVGAHGASAFADGKCTLPWHQGVKHDAAAVMELSRDQQGLLRNALGEEVDAEPRFVFPLAKGSDLFRGRVRTANRFVLVTQKHLGENTTLLKRSAPRLWAYLNRHAEFFERRKSSIYRRRPPFAMFGIGDYSFAKYKVGVSGLHKSPVFRLLGPVEDRPVLLDDTCYFLACRNALQAALISSLLNSPDCLDLLRSLVFTDSKRPITKRVLARIDLGAILRQMDRAALRKRVGVELRSVCTGAERNLAVQEGEWEDLLSETPAEVHGQTARLF